jgi:hypothetical protein
MRKGKLVKTDDETYCGGIIMSLQDLEVWSDGELTEDETEDWLEDDGF